MSKESSFEKDYRERYYDKATGKPKKVIDCDRKECVGKMRGYLADPTFVSGDLWIYECGRKKCRNTERVIL